MLLFTYGTLKRGFRFNQNYLSNATFLGEFTTAPEYTMVDLGAYPGIINKGDTAIVGEVWDVNRADVFFLDMLEGYPDFYDKINIETTYGVATVYILPDTYLKDHDEVKSGEWLQTIKEEEIDDG